MDLVCKTHVASSNWQVNSLFYPRSRTSLEMDEAFHLISFFENPTDGSSIGANKHPWGGMCEPYFCTHKNFMLGGVNYF